MRGMIAWRVHKESCYASQILDNGVYAFTKKKTALWYRHEYMSGLGIIIKIYGYDGKSHKDHPDQRIFKKAIILESDEL